MNKQENLYLSTGELSRQLGVSVRTIRYYDQIGLVKPSRKEAGGKRYYAKEDILQLQKILLLKSLHLSLEDSRRILEEQSMAAVLLVHQSLLIEESGRLENALNHTQSLLNLLDLEGVIEWEDLISLVANSEKERDWNRYFSPDQQSVLKKQLPRLESADVMTKKWINLIKRIKMCLEKEISPQSIEGQLILEDAHILTEETFGDNPELADTFWKVRKSAAASKEMGLYPIEPAVIDFLEMANGKSIPDN